MSEAVPDSKALDLASMVILFVHTYFISKKESEVDFWDMCLRASWHDCLSDTAVSSNAELLRMLLVQEAKPSSDKLNFTLL